jgi:hypothetical protein
MSGNNAQLWILFLPLRDPFPAITAQYNFLFSTENTCAGAIPHRQTYAHVQDAWVSGLYILSHSVLMDLLNIRQFYIGLLSSKQTVCFSGPATLSNT